MGKSVPNKRTVSSNWNTRVTRDADTNFILIRGQEGLVKENEFLVFIE